MDISSLILKKYILINIYFENWKANQKILSAKQLAIKFNISINTVKKVLNSLIGLNILSSKKRVGYFVNPNIYEMLPWSLRKKYNLFLTDLKIIKLKNNIVLKKYYKNQNKDLQAFVESELFEKIFLYNEEYNKDKTFMWNLAYSGIFIFKFDSQFSITQLQNKNYVLEIRKLYDENNKLIAQEKIYVDQKIWRNHKKIIIH